MNRVGLLKFLPIERLKRYHILKYGSVFCLCNPQYLVKTRNK